MVNNFNNKLLINKLGIKNNKIFSFVAPLYNPNNLNDKNLLNIALKRLFYAQKIIILIHYQAIKILLKKAKFNFKKKIATNTNSFS